MTTDKSDARDPKGWILTYSGRRFWPLDPHEDDIDIVDIAHALSNACRFAGHVRRFYSVAQHSVFVSHVCDIADELDGLLHDRTEAYLLDMPKPLKRAAALAGYRAAEDRLEAVTAASFGVRVVMPASVHHADRALLATERRDLMPAFDPKHYQRDELVEPLPGTIRPWSPAVARYQYLTRFVELAPPSRHRARALAFLATEELESFVPMPKPMPARGAHG